ncbi:hypothetical protein B0H19DRAFT_883868, partial [Mycena capillaripes]
TGSLDGETSGACSGTTIKQTTARFHPLSRRPHPSLSKIIFRAFGGTIPNGGACEASGTNARDIATTARGALSSFKGNLRIDIELGSTSC